MRAKGSTGKGSWYESCQVGIDGGLYSTNYEGEGSNMIRGVILGNGKDCGWEKNYRGTINAQTYIAHVLTSPIGSFW